MTSTLEELGKPIHSDEKNQKTTYVTLFGIEKSREIAGKAFPLRLLPSGRSRARAVHFY